MTPQWIAPASVSVDIGIIRLPLSDHQLHQHRDRQRQGLVQPVAAVVLARDIELAQEGAIPLKLAGEVCVELLPVGTRLRSHRRGASVSRAASARPQPFSRYWICPS